MDHYDHDLMTIQIYSPDGMIYDHHGLSCSLQTTDGGITILRKHIPIMVPLTVGAVTVKRRDESLEYIAIDGGVAIFRDNKLLITASFAIRARDIDAAKVEIEKQEATALLYEAENKSDSSQYNRAKIALDRAINQIKISKLQ